MSSRRARLFKPLAIASVLVLVVQMLSLWSFQWVLPGQSIRLGLSQGQLRVWVSKPGDLSALPPGVHVGGWTGDVLQWKPLARSNQKLWVQVNPTGTPVPPGAVNMKQITGFMGALPIVYVLAAVLTTTVWAFPAWRARRRVANHACGNCGYDVRRLPGTRCPECGGLLKRLVVSLTTWLTHATRGSAPSCGRARLGGTQG